MMARAAARPGASLSLLLAALVPALGLALLAAATTPLIPVALLVGGTLVVLVWRRPFAGILVFTGVVAVLPFGVIPIPLAGAQMTFVDATLLLTFGAVLGRALTSRRSLHITRPAIVLLAYIVIAMVAFIAGAASTGAPPELIRRFGKLIVSLLVFIVAGQVLTTENRVAALTRGLMIAGAIQGAVAAALMALPPVTQLGLLTRLSAIGYPTADVLRYVPGPNNTYTDQLRAIGTSVDPNVFGGTMMLALALLVVQWASAEPVLRKSLLALLAIPTATGLLLSLSRSSWLGLAIGVVLVGAMRYRRIVVLALVAGMALLATPQAQSFIVRFVGGFSTADRATAFRFGEYANALTLIGRYPFLGIGFGLSPDIDVTAGVSSVYLLVAEQTGLIGLGAYLAVVLMIWWAGLRTFEGRSTERLQGLAAAFVAAQTGALIAGVLDHYFGNQVFPHAVALFWLSAAGLAAATELSGAAARQAEPERAAAAWPGTRRAHSPTV
ncbi:MAG: O-antigen ligase family protein [Chloroflexota bacterium]